MLFTIGVVAEECNVGGKVVVYIHSSDEKLNASLRFSGAEIREEFQHNMGIMIRTCDQSYVGPNEFIACFDKMHNEREYAESIFDQAYAAVFVHDKIAISKRSFGSQMPKDASIAERANIIAHLADGYDFCMYDQEE